MKNKTVFNNPEKAAANKIRVFNEHGIDGRQVNTLSLKKMILSVLPLWNFQESEKVKTLLEIERDLWENHPGTDTWRKYFNQHKELLDKEQDVYLNSFPSKSYIHIDVCVSSESKSVGTGFTILSTLVRVVYDLVKKKFPNSNINPRSFKGTLYKMIDCDEILEIQECMFKRIP